MKLDISTGMSSPSCTIGNAKTVLSMTQSSPILGVELACGDSTIIIFHRPYFTAEVFGRLQTAEGSIGRVRAVSLFNYIMRRVWLQQTRIGLSLYDVTGQGYLTEHVSDALIVFNS